MRLIAVWDAEDGETPIKEWELFGGWDDECREAALIPLQGQQGDPDRDTDGTLLFDASSVEQVAVRYQLSHARVPGTPVKFHVHWSKSTAAAGEVRREMRYRAWNINTVRPDWGAWVAASGRSMVLGATMETVAETFPEIPGSGLYASAMVAIQLRRKADDAGDTYGADARLEDLDIHQFKAGFGTPAEY